ncbi:hypothetical protein NFX46_40115 (plasmid) [Streptomyces phaeoluteigriseus]|uniref:Secreted protein n=1 Tax=Streptomyces phaeoluteigriseus TaxID=114686 RepID=A0ABY4ZNP3_9ACTN|nr:hypothetical protein [Streptomyces phaeoluteigriseus]USQ89892.1 hypothetical protein NFX46_40115 [Streptomyces phaeoluteigriseus]
MRKLRDAALVAAVAGTISVFGVGNAFAHSHAGDADRGTSRVTCHQGSQVTYVTHVNGLVNGPLPGSGPATATSTQQICSGNDSKGGGAEPDGPGVLTTVQVEGTPVVAEGGGGTATSTATCPAGTVVTGGGFVAAPTPPNPDVEYVFLENQRGPGNSWQVTIEGFEDTTFYAVAECATLS